MKKREAAAQAAPTVTAAKRDCTKFTSVSFSDGMKP